MMLTTIAYYALWFLAVLFILLYFYSTRNFNYWKNRNVPYLKPIPFFGNMLPVMSQKECLGEWLGRETVKMNSDYFGIFLFDQPVLVLKSPKLVKSIMQKNFDHFPNRTVASYDHDPVLTNIPFFTSNSKWKIIRSKMTPAFTSGLADYIQTLANVPNVETKEVCAKYATNVIARCAFAVDAQSFTNPNAEFRNIGRTMFDFRYSTAFRQMGAWLKPNFFNKFNIGFFDPQTIRRLSEIFKEVLYTRTKSSSFKGHDLIDILLDMRKKDESEFTDDILVAQAIQFFIAGFETASSALSFGLYEVCVNPDIQERLRTEIMENINRHNGVTYEGIAEMQYLEMCLSESFRKYPVVPFLDRMCTRDFKEENSDLVIEKGTPVYIPMFGLHHSPKLFPNPGKFDPERFADKTKINAEGLYYLPFGEGPRICIGNRFGMMVLKLGFVAVLTKFKLEKTEKTPIPIKYETKTFLLQSKVGIPIKFVPL